MSLDPSDGLQLLMGLFLGVIGYMVRQVLTRLEGMERAQQTNTYRLVRIETKLGIPENHHNDLA